MEFGEVCTTDILYIFSHRRWNDKGEIVADGKNCASESFLYALKHGEEVLSTLFDLKSHTATTKTFVHIFQINRHQMETILPRSLLTVHI